MKIGYQVSSMSKLGYRDLLKFVFDFYILARSSCRKVCMPISNQFWSLLSARFHTWIFCQL